jgi:hypothetical protein
MPTHDELPKEIYISPDDVTQRYWVTKPDTYMGYIARYVPADDPVPADVTTRITATLTSLTYCPPEYRVGLVYEKLLWPYLLQINELTKRLSEQLTADKANSNEQ